MDNYHLKKAAADSSVTALMFLEQIKAALASPGGGTKRIATEAFILKSGKCSSQDFGELQEVVKNLDIAPFEKECIVHFSSIGFRFFNRTSANDYQKLAEAVVWLIENDPKNSCLEMPYCTDLGPDSHEKVSLKWRQAISKNPKDVCVIFNASQFFFMEDPVESRKLLVRCIALEPSNSLWKESIEELESLHGE